MFFPIECSLERVVMSAEPCSSMFCFHIGLHYCPIFSVFASVLFIFIAFFCTIATYNLVHVLV